MRDLGDRVKIPSRKILDRDVARAIDDDYRKRAAPVLAEVVDQGIAAFERCSNSATGREENLAILFPALHVFEMLDGVDILLREWAVIPARLQMRSAFEAKLTVEYVTEANSNLRGAAFIVAEIHRRIGGLDRWDPTAEAGKQLRAEFRKDKIARGVEIPVVDDLPERIEGLRRLLNEEPFKEAAAEYDRVLRSRQGRPVWHSLWNGPGNLQDLARHVGRGGQYEILYRTWSRTAHGFDLERQLTEKDGQAAIQPFRDPRKIGEMYSHAIGFGIETIFSILAHYRGGEIEGGGISSWYVREIRPVFQALNMEEPAPLTNSEEAKPS